MSVSTLDIPPIDMARAPAVRSPFENTVLPAFSRWLVERVEALRPDLFVPVEIKGALLLSAAEAYAAERLGTPLRVPVLYAPALAYMDEAELAARRPVLLDDATRSRNTLRRHQALVERHGGRPISLLACIGLAGANSTPQYEEGPPVECFRTVDEELYHELLWQLAELVVSRGLPPEVDHHMFSLRMRGDFAANWRALAGLLRPLGKLTVDGATTTNGDVVSMTLHFPALPTAPRYPVHGGPVRDEGVKKLRLFADLAHRAIHVVPMAFPALDLPAGTVDDVPAAMAREIARGWTQDRETIADLLLERARRRDPELLFRVISATTEADLIVAFAAELAKAMPDATLSLASERPLFRRLYGAHVGDELADRLDADIAEVLLGATGARATVPPGSPYDDDEPPAGGRDVRWATREISNHLRWLHGREMSVDADPMRRVGLSLSELGRDVVFGRLDPLLISRCVDFGLAKTTLVPYTDKDVRADGRVQVRRKYRVSEGNRWGERYEDVDTMRQELEEETLALVARVLGERVDAWPDGVPYTVVERVAAILPRIVLEERGVKLRTVAARDGMKVVLGPDDEPQSIVTVTTEQFNVNGELVTPTGGFDGNYDADRLRLDRANATTEIENFLKELAGPLRGTDDVEELLRAWSYTAQPKMGFDVVETHLRHALDACTVPVKLLSAERPLEPALLAEKLSRAREQTRTARDILDLLADGPAVELRRTWPPRDKAARRLADALATPTEPDALLALAHRTGEAVAALIDLVQRAANNDHEQTTVAVIAGCHRLEALLTALPVPNGEPRVPADATERRRYMASRLKDTTALLRCHASAIAWRYRGIVPTRPADRGTRWVTVLVADLAGSTPESIERSHADGAGWANDALALVAQWGAAFGGQEVNQRRGDDIYLEFAEADSAVLCGAVVQEHTRALRCTGGRAPEWNLRIAVDVGEISNGDNGVLGAPLNTAAKLGKFADEDADAFERVLVTPSAHSQCSPQLREALSIQMEREVVIAADHAFGPAAERAVFRPWSVAAEPAVRAAVLEPAVDPGARDRDAAAISATASTQGD